MRIIAGEHRGRKLAAPKGDGTRPTTDRVRESLMSAIASARGGFEGAMVLDAFAGSGALAFEALDNGNSHEYLSILRRSLKTCPGEKNMVQFLLDRFIEDTRPQASPELLALAEKVRTILAAYGPDNPAVEAIRESEAYKQVAWIIEPEPMGQMVQ